MREREIKDNENLTWVCVATFAGSSEAASEKAAELMKNKDGKVPVVCTPKGGAMSVRLELSEDWLENISDEQLLKDILSNKK